MQVLEMTTPGALSLTNVPVCSVSGALGGLALFLYEVRTGAIENNRHFIKMTTDVVGGLLLATFIGNSIAAAIEPVFRSAFDPRSLIGFGVGLSWSEVVQVVRKIITAKVRAELGKLTTPAKTNEGD
jgi:hypothetical protein